MSYRGYEVDIAEFDKIIAKKGYSLSELAQKARISRATISNIRRGRLPSIYVIGKLSLALELNGTERERIFFANNLRNK